MTEEVLELLLLLTLIGLMRKTYAEERELCDLVDIGGEA